jgi:biotin carboxylase
VHVIAVDRDPQAVGFVLADERAIISSEDEEAVDRLARAREVHGIVSPGADWPVGIAARVAERIGLSHTITARTGSIVTSKARQREAFADAGVPHARELDPRQGELRFPLVVKAPDRQGQRGLGLVYSPGELEAALVTAIAESRGGAVLVEEHVEGPEVTVNAVSVDGRFMPLTVTDRLTAEPPAFGVALAHAWPSRRETTDAVAAAGAAVEAVGIRNGPSYTQLRLGPTGPVVMEVAARLGGGHDAELCAAAIRVDLNALAVAMALAEVPGDAVSLRIEQKGDASPGGAAVVFLLPPPGRLLEVEGLADAEALPGVEWVRVYRRPGHVFGPLRRGADRAGAVLVTGADRDDALERGRRAADAVRFRVDADAS